MGALWIIGAVIGELSPANTGLGWMVINVAGLITSIYFGFTDRGGGDQSRQKVFGLKYLITFAILIGFITLVFFVFSPVSQTQVHTFITVLFAALYTGAGVWRGKRYALIGIVLAVLSVGTFIAAPDLVPLVTSGVGGGVLTLTGFWMRAA